MRKLFILIFYFSSLIAGPKVVLFNDTSAWYHWGCTGTSTALKERIAQLGFTLEALPISINSQLQEVPSFEEFDSLDRFNRFAKANEPVLDRIQNSDAVIITGEGTLALKLSCKQ
jgi:hypothetical protein